MPRSVSRRLFSRKISVMAGTSVLFYVFACQNGVCGWVGVKER